MKFDEIWEIFEEKEWMKNDVVGYEWRNMDQIERKMTPLFWTNKKFAFFFNCAN